MNQAPPLEWTHRNFNDLFARLRDNDRKAVDTAIALIEQDAGRPFGMLVKSEAARILRQRAVLHDLQTHRLRVRFTDMLLRAYLPPEYKAYAKLFRKIGLGPFRDAIAAQANSVNPSVRRWCWYLLVDHQGPRPRRYQRPW